MIYAHTFAHVSNFSRRPRREIAAASMMNETTAGRTPPFLLQVLLGTVIIERNIYDNAIGRTAHLRKVIRIDRMRVNRARTRSIRSGDERQDLLRGMYALCIYGCKP